MGRRPPLMCVRQVLTPERKLWLAVLEQACADADAAPGSDPDVEPATRVMARRFLRAAGSHEAELLALVCDFADVPFDRVVLWARKRFPPEPVEPDSVEDLIADKMIAIELSDSAPN